jgi:hypothetical protein
MIINLNLVQTLNEPMSIQGKIIVHQSNKITAPEEF